MFFDSKEQIVQWMKASARTAVQAVLATTSGWSKIGGLPDFSEAHLWPVWNGRPLSFLAQLDFSEIAAVTDLPDFPRSGRAFFFYDLEQSTAGFDPKDKGSWQVLFEQNISKNAVALELPTGLSLDSIFKEKSIGFRAIQTTPDHYGRIKTDPKKLSMSDIDEIVALKSSCYGKYAHHQVGGFPAPVQGDDMELECQLVSNGLYCGNATGYNDPRRPALEAGAADWALLFQLDTDDDTGMMWGDVGMLYFWIRREDLLNSDFSKTWMILQCS